MIRSLQIQRQLKAADFDALIEILDALGLEQLSSGIGGEGRSASFRAPEGKITISSTHSLVRSAKAPDVVLEVTNSESIHELAQQRGWKISSEGKPNSGTRSFMLTLAGGLQVGIQESRSAEQLALEGRFNAAGLRFGIVVSRFNSFITERLLAGAEDALLRSGAKKNQITIVRVPGSFEIPAAARILADNRSVDAIICLGCILRGETSHFEHISNEVARGIGQSAQDTGIPHSFGVLTCDSLEQAIDRAGLKSGNKGFEAALAAVQMASLRQMGSSSAANPPNAAEER